jgi:ABC-type ATPase with predicted acetyltransferase domain
MPLWKCNGCGYEAKGNCRPKECPECKAPKENFLKAEEAKPKAAKAVKPAKKAAAKPVKKKTK